MTRPLDYHGTWAKRRYDWKRQVAASQDLSRGAKLLATLLCDTYANHRTACCWPSNKTLAGMMGGSVRSVQRYIGELAAGGWLVFVRLPRRRRAMQLVFPALLAAEHDNGHDRPARASMTIPTPEHDTSVTPYIEPKKNLRERGTRHAYHLIPQGDTLSIEDWKAWLGENVDCDADTVLGYLVRGESYMFPRRFPDRTPAAREKYLAYFEAAIETNGAMFE